VYNKLFTKILDSTIWLESDSTRLVWITFIAAMDEDGFVALSSVGNVAARARVSLEAAAAAILSLESPDAQDKTQDHDGRRIERVPSGWMVLNAAKYRDIILRASAREQTRARVAKHRARNADVTHGNGEKRNVTPSVAVAVAVAEAKKDTSSRKNGARQARIDSSPVIQTLPLREGGDFQVHQSLIAELEPLYPSVDVTTTIGEMKGWLIGNPTKRKTRRGVTAFITRWLQQEQEKASGV
jgi:hypothetical protein